MWNPKLFISVLRAPSYFIHVEYVAGHTIDASVCHQHYVLCAAVGSGRSGVFSQWVISALNFHLHNHFNRKILFLLDSICHSLSLSCSLWAFALSLFKHLEYYHSHFEMVRRVQITQCVIKLSFSLSRSFQFVFGHSFISMNYLIVIHAALQIDLEHFKTMCKYFCAVPFNNSFFFGYISHKIAYAISNNTSNNRSGERGSEKKLYRALHPNG